jgi:drug/metabolite transporter (DMT)-like permease
MNPALLGSMTAFGWGGADFIARFTGRSVGHEHALFGMLSTSTVILSLIVWQMAEPLVWHPGGWWLLLLTGLGILVDTLFLYWALANGPVSLVAPISASYPALNVAFGYLVLGSRPTAGEWIGMAVVMAGVLVVVRAGRSFEGKQGYTAETLRKVVLASVGSAITFAITIAAGQASAPIYGELHTTVIARWIALFVLTALLLGVRRSGPRIPGRIWPILWIQGMLDSGAYIALFAGGHLARAEVAIVVGSTYCGVTAVLGRVVLREPMTLLQWAGIALVLGGVAALAAQG